MTINPKRPAWLPTQGAWRCTRQQERTRVLSGSRPVATLKAASIPILMPYELQLYGSGSANRQGASPPNPQVWRN